MTDRQRDWLYKRTEVGEVWGVGRRIGQQLKDAGVSTVLDLKNLDPVTVKRQWAVVLERTVRELNGIACIDLEKAPAPKQQSACTRSFGQKVTELRELEQAITEFASGAVHKLRGQDSQANAVLVFIRTSPFRLQDWQYSRSITVPLRLPSSDTLRIVGARFCQFADRWTSTHSRISLILHEQPVRSGCFRPRPTTLVDRLKPKQPFHTDARLVVSTSRKGKSALWRFSGSISVKLAGNGLSRWHSSVHSCQGSNRIARKKVMPTLLPPIDIPYDAFDATSLRQPSCPAE